MRLSWRLPKYLWLFISILQNGINQKSSGSSLNIIVSRAWLAVAIPALWYEALLVSRLIFLYCFCYVQAVSYVPVHVVYSYIFNFLFLTLSSMTQPDFPSVLFSRFFDFFIIGLIFTNGHKTTYLFDFLTPIIYLFFQWG